MTIIKIVVSALLSCFKCKKYQKIQFHEYAYNVIVGRAFNNYVIETLKESRWRTDLEVASNNNVETKANMVT